MIAVILGLPRSGTTLLGRILAGVDGIHYEEEPNVIWRYRNYGRLGHDQFGSELAGDEIRRYVRGYFDRQMRRTAARALVEKTPANVLRPEFVLRVLPEAKLIVVTRNREAIVDSIMRRVVLGEDRNAERLDDDRRFRFMRLKARRLAKVPLRDLPVYMPQILSDLSGGRLFPSNAYWGPRHRGWQETLRLPVNERIERQCTAMTNSLEAFLGNYSGEVLTIAYEDLCANPDMILNRVEHYLDLPSGRLARSRVDG